LGFLSRHKRVFFAVLVIFCVAAIIFTARQNNTRGFFTSALAYITIPAQKAGTKAMNWLSETLHDIINMKQIISENASLREQVASMSEDNTRLKMMEDENKKLSDLLNIHQRYPDYPIIGALKVAEDTNNWFNTFIVDKGGKDGVQVDMVVLGNGGLVGKVTMIGPNFSKITPLINNISSISAECVRTKDTGFVRGNFDIMKDNLCRMDYLSMDAQIMSGDEIVTSGLGQLYPPGITIGFVQTVVTDGHSLTKYAVIKPAVDFRQLDTVLIIDKLFSGFDEKAEFGG